MSSGAASGSTSLLRFANSRALVIGITNTKYTTAAVMRKVMIAEIRAPTLMNVFGLSPMIW